MSHYLKNVKDKFSDPVFTYQYYQGIRYLVSLLISVVLVKSALPVEDLGHFELWMFIIAACTTFWSTGVRNALLSYFPKLDTESAHHLIRYIFGLLFLTGLLCGLFIWLFPESILHLFTDVGILPLVPLFSFYLILSVPLILTETILYLDHRPSTLVKYTHWSQGGQLLLFCIIGWLSPSLFYFLSGLVAITFVRMLFLIYLVFGKRVNATHNGTFRLFIIFSVPLIFNMLLGSAMDIIDGWFVSKYFDVSFFPIFRYGARELPFSTILFSSLSAAMIPVLMKEGIASDVVRQRVNRLMHVLFPVSLVCMILSPFLFPLFYSFDYKTSAYVFNTYLLILTSRVLLPQTYNFALHQHGVIIWSGIIEIVINLLLSYLWMQIWGVYGLAMATVVAYFGQKLILIWYNYRYNGIKIHAYIDVRSYLIYSILSLFVFFLTFKYF